MSARLVAAMRRLFSVTIHVDFPSLDALVAYLQSAQQKQIDDLAATIGQLTGQLQQSSTGLQGAMDQTTKEQ